jgi:hypothetical protein
VERRLARHAPTIPWQTRRSDTVFDDARQTQSGTSLGGREWAITAIPAGWRLEFRDPGDEAWTYAGTFGSAENARLEASRV